MGRFVDRLSDLFANIAAWMFFAIGAMVTFEVLARYLFLSPTIWAEELSQFFQIWATYLAAAYVLRHRKLIVIEFFIVRLSSNWRKVSESFSLLVIIVFSLVAIWYGTEILLESIEQGRNTSTMLGVPKWMTESAIPIGFGLLLAQALVELVRVFTVGVDNIEAHSPLEDI